MRWANFACAGLAGCLSLMPVAGRAEGSPDGLQLLQKVAVATQQLSYSGTFIYRNGRQSETSRIAHVMANGRLLEKLEVLDGSPREVIRQDEAFTCYLPDRKLMIVEPRGTRRAFPALLPVSLAGLNEYYSIRRLGTARVAGIDGQVVRLDPRDALRYGREFLIDQDSGLLLKATTLDARGESLESLAFTELHVGVPDKLEALVSSFADAAKRKDAWQVRQAQLRDIHDDAQWQFRAELPGFRRQASMIRTMPGKAGEKGREVMHWVFSDGLAALSVFISPPGVPDAEHGESDVASIGAISMIRRVIGGQEVVVMGDVPPAAIQRFAAGIVLRASK